MRRSEHDSLAQLAEHLTFNQGVRGSNPRWITNMNRDSFESLFFFSLKRKLKLVAEVIFTGKNKVNVIQLIVIKNKREANIYGQL